MIHRPQLYRIVGVRDNRTTGIRSSGSGRSGSQDNSHYIAGTSVPSSSSFNIQPSAGSKPLRKTT